MAESLGDLLDRLIARLVETMDEEGDSDYGAVSVLRMAKSRLSSWQLDHALTREQRLAVLNGIRDLNMGVDGDDLELGQDELVDLIERLI